MIPLKSEWTYGNEKAKKNLDKYMQSKMRRQERKRN